MQCTADVWEIKNPIWYILLLMCIYFSFLSYKVYSRHRNNQRQTIKNKCDRKLFFHTFENIIRPRCGGAAAAAIAARSACRWLSAAHRCVIRLKCHVRFKGFLNVTCNSSNQVKWKRHDAFVVTFVKSRHSLFLSPRDSLVKRQFRPELSSLRMQCF